MIDKIVDGRTDLVLELLKQSDTKSLKDSQGTSLIRWCAYYGDVLAVKLLVEAGESLDDLGNNKGLSAAAFHGHWQLTQYLVEQGADVNFVDNSTGETALHAALCKANRPVYDLIVQILLSAGADANVKTIADKETGSFMRDVKTKGETALHRAAAFASEVTIKRLLEAGAEVAIKDVAGDSPLSWASWHCRPDAILRMLSYDGFTIHPQRNSQSDHGAGWGAMDHNLMGQPHL